MVMQALGVVGSMGWLNDSFKKADQMLGLFLVSRLNQDPFFKVEASLPWLLVKHEGKPYELADDVKAVLTDFFGAHYALSKIEVTASQETPGLDNKWVLKIDLDLRDEKDRTISLGRLIGYEGSKLLQIAALNNGSLPTTA